MLLTDNSNSNKFTTDKKISPQRKNRNLSNFTRNFEEVAKVTAEYCIVTENTSTMKILEL